jgi:hypothetical protein
MRVARLPLRYSGSFNALKSLHLFNCRVLWPSFGHNVRAQRRPRTLRTVPPVGARQRSNIHRFPHSAHEPPACLSVHTSDFSQHQAMRRVSETQSNAPVKKLFEQLRTNSARFAMDQSRWWVRSREQGWVNSGERQGAVRAFRIAGQDRSLSCHLRPRDRILTVAGTQYRE